MKVSSTRGSDLARTLVALAAALGLVAVDAPPANADSPRADPALAETLFRQGKALLEAGDYAKACPKLAESQAVDPGTGTLLALAICHEREGKTATAWAEFSEVAAAAKREGRRDREKAAREKVTALEPRLSRLTILVSDNGAIEVKRDGVVVGPTARGTATPIDPGAHEIQAAAPGKKTWTKTITVGAKNDNVRLVVPTLEDEPAPPPPVADAPAPKPSPVAEAPPPSSKRNLGFVLGGTGIVAIGIGTYFGVRALSENGNATTLCPSTCTDPHAVSLSSDARSDARIADVVIGLGIVALGVGAVFVLTSPSPHAAEPSKSGLASRLGQLAESGGGIRF